MREALQLRADHDDEPSRAAPTIDHKRRSRLLPAEFTLPNIGRGGRALGARQVETPAGTGLRRMMTVARREDRRVPGRFSPPEAASAKRRCVASAVPSAL